MLDPLEIYLSPNHENLKVHVNKVPKGQQFKHQDWIIDEIKLYRDETPKTIVFCNTMNKIASVVNYFFANLIMKILTKQSLVFTTQIPGPQIRRE